MTKELTVKKEQALANPDKDIFSVDDEGREDRGSIARIMVLQSNSEAVQDDGERLGTYYHKAAKENLGEEVEFIAIKILTGAVLMRVGEGLVCRTGDGVTNMHGDKCVECPFNAYYDGEWVNGRGPDCQKTIDVFGLWGPDLLPGIISFRSKGYKVGRELRQTLRFSKGRPKIKLGITKDKNDKGTFFVPKLVGKTLELNDIEKEQFIEWKQRLATMQQELNDAQADTH